MSARTTPDAKTLAELCPGPTAPVSPTTAELRDMLTTVQHARQLLDAELARAAALRAALIALLPRELCRDAFRLPEVPAIGSANAKAAARLSHALEHASVLFEGLLQDLVEHLDEGPGYLLDELAHQLEGGAA